MGMSWDISMGNFLGYTGNIYIYIYIGNILGYESSGSTDWLKSRTSPKLSFAINGKMCVHSPIILPISNHLSPMVKLVLYLIHQLFLPGI